jgi:hypothetical protein
LGTLNSASEGCSHRREKEGSSSFLKKRTKKLLLMGVRGPFPRTPTDKSFLVLFFKKELLPFLALVL